MTEQETIAEFYTMVEDPLAPQRHTAWHINLATVVTEDDGRRWIKGPIRQRNMQQAIAEGWTLPAILKSLNTEVAAERDALAAEIAALPEADFSEPDDPEDTADPEPIAESVEPS